jgi:hypothetical protein
LERLSTFQRSKTTSRTKVWYKRKRLISLYDY